MTKIERRDIPEGSPEFLMPDVGYGHVETESSTTKEVYWTDAVTVPNGRLFICIGRFQYRESRKSRAKVQRYMRWWWSYGGLRVSSGIIYFNKAGNVTRNV